MSQVESFWHWKTYSGQFEFCHSPTHSVLQGSHTLSGICAARTIMLHGSWKWLGRWTCLWMWSFSAWTEDLHPCFVWVLNMLDCIVAGSRDIRQEVNKKSFLLDLFDKLMVCEVNEPSGVFFFTGRIVLANLLLPFTHTLSSPGITYTFRHMCCQSHHVAW